MLRRLHREEVAGGEAGWHAVASCLSLFALPSGVSSRMLCVVCLQAAVFARRGASRAL